jgi:hypothetical protein
MKKFRKKPIVIEAYQFTGNNLEGPVCRGPDEKDAYIDTLEGRMIVSPGDWVIKGVKGEFYPCKPDIFEFTYDRSRTRGKMKPLVRHYEISKWTGPELDWVDALCMQHNGYPRTTNWREVTCKKCLRKMNRAQEGSQFQNEIDTGNEPVSERKVEK